jgi:hypothetical protein
MEYISVSPYMNWGRWLIACPKCGTKFSVRKRDTEFTCSVCHPDLMAVAYNRVIDSRGREIFRPVDDDDLRMEAREKAKKIGESYPIAWPQNLKEIEAILLMRPNKANRNWKTETPDELRAENLAHGCMLDKGGKLSQEMVSSLFVGKGGWS